MKEYKEQGGQRPNIYHRLVGALVLVALAVIVVPMILDLDTDRISLTSRSNVPEKPKDYRIVEVPLTADGGVAAEAAVDPGLNLPAGQDAAPQEAPPAPPGKPQPDQSAGKPPAFVVQVGSFSSPENALALRDRLRAKGYKGVFVDRDSAEGKPVMRVRIGPELERSRSEQVRERLAREMNLQGMVVSYDGSGTRVE